MANRLQSQRLVGPSRHALLLAGLFLPFAAGCQSNAQHDLVARELRMQEDQLYAMEDYLNQYQQLVCKYRSENAALRRQLEGRVDDDLPSPRTRNGAAPADDRLEIDVTPDPRPSTAPLPDELEVPDVPALEETTDDPTLPFQPRAHTLRTPHGMAASAAMHAGPQDQNVTLALAHETRDAPPPPHDVWLSGEVIAGDTDSGPRIVVDVTPLDAAGEPAEFFGPLSVMILANSGDAPPENLARWDFSPDDLQAASGAAGNDGRFRFFVELPADTPITDSTEIWARLLSGDGAKLLTHTALDLAAPGAFSSMPNMPVPAQSAPEPPLLAASADATTVSPPVDFAMNDAGWQTAKPGQPAGVAGKPRDSSSDWRPSTQPMPVVVAHSTAAPRSAAAVVPEARPSPPAKKKTTPKPLAAEAPKPAGWSPDRQRSASPARTATRQAQPQWSPTR